MSPTDPEFPSWEIADSSMRTPSPSQDVVDLKALTSTTTPDDQLHTTTFATIFDQFYPTISDHLHPTFTTTDDDLRTTNYTTDYLHPIMSPTPSKEPYIHPFLRNLSPPVPAETIASYLAYLVEKHPDREYYEIENALGVKGKNVEDADELLRFTSHPSLWIPAISRTPSPVQEPKSTSTEMEATKLEGVEQPLSGSPTTSTKHTATGIEAPTAVSEAEMEATKKFVEETLGPSPKFAATGLASLKSPAQIAAEIDMEANKIIQEILGGYPSVAAGLAALESPGPVATTEVGMEANMSVEHNQEAAEHNAAAGDSGEEGDGEGKVPDYDDVMAAKDDLRKAVFDLADRIEILRMKGFYDGDRVLPPN